MAKSKALSFAVIAFGAAVTLGGCTATADNRPNLPPQVACPYGTCVPRLQQFYYYQPYVPYYYGPGPTVIFRFGGHHHHHRR